MKYLLLEVAVYLVCSAQVWGADCNCTPSNPIVQVQVLNGDVVLDTKCYDSGEDIDHLEVESNWTRIEIYSLNSSTCGQANIGRITLTAPSGTLPDAFSVMLNANIPGTSFPDEFTDLDVAGNDWSGLDFDGPQATTLRDRTRLDGRIQGDLTNSVEAGVVGVFWVGGVVDDDIVVGDGTTNALDNYRFGGISDSGSLQSRTRSIALLEVGGDCAGLVRTGVVFPTSLQDITTMTVEGNLLGTVDVAHYLLELTVQGAIGESGSPARIGVGHYLGELSCGNLIANIGGYGTYPRADQIHRITVTSGNGGSGDFEGSILCRDLRKHVSDPGFLRFDGEMRGVIQTNEELPPDESLIEVGTSSGLIGRVIIGANNTSQNWTWTAPVTIGSTVLEDPNIPAYPNSAASLGGGSIGLVPFQLHATDCEPANGDTLPYCEPPTEIRMRHYGPVTWDGENDPDPFIIERRRIGSTDSWVDHSDCFTQAIDSGDSAVVVLTPGVALQSGFDYRVRLRQDSGENVLRCDLLEIATLPEVADHASDFVFCAGVVGLGDANGDGIVNKDDHTCVNANLYTTDCLTLGDANRDGSVDLDDRTCVTENWLNEYVMCPIPLLAMSSESSECERTMYDALVAMGFENAAEYIAFVGELAVEEQALILVAVDEWMECKR